MKSTTVCPHPNICKYDDYYRSGNHLCMRGTCPHKDTAKKQLEKRIAYLYSQQTLCQRDIDEIRWCEDMLRKLC